MHLAQSFLFLLRNGRESSGCLVSLDLVGLDMVLDG
jgi:hypothetical protein